MRPRGGSATVRASASSRRPEPDTGREALHTDGARTPGRTREYRSHERPIDAAVDVRHRLAVGARVTQASYVLGNPARQAIEDVLDDAEVVVLRVLGSSAEMADELSALRATGLPLIVLGGERAPSAELMECSTVPIGLAAQAHSYLAEGGPANLAQLHAFLCDTVLLTGEGFDEPVAIPEWGYAERHADVQRGRRGSACCTTGPTRSAATPDSRMRWPTRSTPPAARSACRSSRPRCAARPTNCSTHWALWTPSWSACWPRAGRSRQPPARVKTTPRGTSSVSPR